MLPTTEAMPNQLTYASLIRYDELEKNAIHGLYSSIRC